MSDLTTSEFDPTLKIWKFPLQSIVGSQKVGMPRGATILHASLQHSTLCVWALCDPDVGRETREFEIFTTGCDISPANRNHLCTFQMGGGNLIYHLFEKV